MSRQVADDILDMFFSLESYQFLGTLGAVTLTGYFVGPPSSVLQFGTPPSGQPGSAGTEYFRKGALFTIAVPQQNGSNLPVGFEAAVDAISGHVGIPSDAAGAILITTGATLFDIGGPTSKMVNGIDIGIGTSFIVGAATGSWPTSFSPADGTVLFGRVHWGSK